MEVFAPSYLICKIYKNLIILKYDCILFRCANGWSLIINDDNLGGVKNQERGEFLRFLFICHLKDLNSNHIGIK